MRVLTWNVAGRVKRQAEQAAAVAAVAADVVALQEVTARTLPMWRDALASAGLRHNLSALEGPDKGRGALESALEGRGALGVAAQRRGRRALGVLTAAREPLEPLTPPAVPWPERVLVCATAPGIEIVNLHSPIAPAPDLAKIRTHEAVAEYLRDREQRPMVLCGDLNTPRRELPDGEILTFAHDSSGRLRPERGERWDRAERALVYGLRQNGWVDAFRELHGYGTRDASWTFKDDRGGWRLDHVLATGLTPTAAAYAHEWRRAGLSDHSALVVDFA